jgi:hypothetical protein
MMKKIHYILYILAVLALLGSCSQALEPPVSREGSVILNVSTGASGGAPASVRTILPEDSPSFNHYKLVFSKEGSADITIDDSDGLTGSVYRQELEAGTWTVRAEAYRSFTPTGETEEKEYLAARGSKSLTVAPGAVTEETVELEPVPVNEPGAPKGIFTYTVIFPDGASGTLTLGTGDPVSLSSGTGVSLELDPGYYDLIISLTITLTNGSLSAGDSEKVHIYSGLESKYEFAFTGDDFTALVYLTGTISLPSGIDSGDISGGTIKAYSDAAYTNLIATNSVEIQAASTWLMGIPLSCIGSPVYLVVEARGRNGKIYTGTGTVPSVDMEAGVRNIELEDTTNPGGVADQSAVPGDGRVHLRWTNPEDRDLDHIEITFSPGAPAQPITVPKGIKTKTITGLSNGTPYIFTITAVDTAGNSSIVQTVDGEPVAGVSVSGIGTHLGPVTGEENADNPIFLPLASGTNLPAEWSSILSAIAGKYVALDLSACTANGEFDPGMAAPGESFIVSLILPDTATSIKAGYYSNPTFQYFTNLKQAGGEGIITIGDFAFQGCIALTEVSFPKATDIDWGAFYGCSALTEASFPKATDIGELAFYDCSALTEASFPEATSIGDYAFLDCSALTEASFPAATSISYEAFSGCSALTEASFPVANYIGFYAFEGCSALTEAYFPAAADIGDRTFLGCSALTEAYFPAAASISYEAFSGCSALTEAYFPAAADIGDRAFLGCSALTEAYFPKATSIGNFAFANCSDLTEAYFPEAASIISGAFSGCSALTEVYFPEAASIGGYAFEGCSALTEASFPAAASIGNSAFLDCSALTEASFPEATDIGGGAFRGCSALTEASFPKAASIGNSAFLDCSALTEASFPEAASIGEWAFAYCSALTEASFPEATDIGEGAFDGCSALTEAYFPKATSIGNFAFANCSDLREASFPEAASIGNYAFAYTGTTTLTLTRGNAVPTLGYWMFYYVLDEKTVTVKVPSGATGYAPPETTFPAIYSGSDATPCWGNGFRGLGWNGSTVTAYLNSNITLTIQYE